MKAHDAFPILYARVERTASFYRGALGFEEAFRWPDDGSPEFVYLAMKLADG